MVAISTMVITAIVRMHRPGLAVAKHVMGIKAKASRVVFGLTARQHSASPKADNARMISRALVRLKISTTITSVITLLVMANGQCVGGHQRPFRHKKSLDGVTVRALWVGSDFQSFSFSAPI
ncbi:hypothetical protein OB03_14335 [Brevundimonas sp. GN22]